MSEADSLALLIQETGADYDKHVIQHQLQKKFLLVIKQVNSRTHMDK